MDIITAQQLRQIIETGAPPCVSLYMPTHRAGRDVRQDPARLKNLLAEAEAKLIDKGMRPTKARDLLEPARQLIDRPEFWMNSQSGVAIFLCEGTTQIYRLPVEVEDCVCVNDRFEIKPLLPLMGGRLFYVLAVAQNNVRLIECTENSCRELSLPGDVALSIEDAVSGDENKTDSVRHGGDASRPASMGGEHHGQANDVQRKEHEDRMFFFRQLDDGVRRVMREPSAPVVLAAADPTAAEFRQASDIRTLCEAHIHGNPERARVEALHDQAKTILGPIWREELSRLQNQFGTAYAHHLASDNINQIVPAAAQGRVGILFVAPQLSHPGHFDPQAQFVDERVDDEDLVDAAAVHTLMTGGQIVVVPKEDLPGKGEIAAIYRYMA